MNKFGQKEAHQQLTLSLNVHQRAMKRQHHTSLAKAICVNDQPDDSGKLCVKSQFVERPLGQIVPRRNAQTMVKIQDIEIIDNSAIIKT